MRLTELMEQAGLKFQILVLMVLAQGCGGSPPPRNPGGGWTVLVCFDVSGSMDEEERKLSCRVLNWCIDMAISPRQTPVVLYEYDCRRPARLICEVTPKTSRDLLPFEWRILNSRTAPRKGSYVAVALQAIVEEARSRRRKKVIGLVLTDGEDFDPRATRRVAGLLAALDNVRAIFVGPVEDGEFRTALKRNLAALGDRCFTAGPLDVKHQLEALRAWIRAEK